MSTIKTNNLAHTANGASVYTLPQTDGSAGQVLTTNGSGVLSWANDSAGKILQVATNTISGSSSIASDADNPTASGLITTVTTQGTGSSFLVSSVGANPHVNSSASNSSIKLFLYASVNSGTYANVFGSEPFQAYHATAHWIDFPGVWTVHVTGLSYTVGQTIAFQPYYQEGGSSSSTNYFHHSGGSGGSGKIRLTVQEIAA